MLPLTVNYLNIARSGDVTKIKTIQESIDSLQRQFTWVIKRDESEGVTVPLKLCYAKLIPGGFLPTNVSAHIRESYKGRWGATQLTSFDTELPPITALSTASGAALSTASGAALSTASGAALSTASGVDSGDCEGYFDLLAGKPQTKALLPQLKPTFQVNFITRLSDKTTLPRKRINNVAAE